MKSFKILLMAALTIMSVSVSAQEKAGKKETAKHVKLYTCTMHDTVAMKKPGNCPVCGMKLQRSKKEQLKTEVMKTYACPMHPEVTSNEAGKCPKCGMDMTMIVKEKMKTEVMKGYSCPMHPDVTSEKPGKCSKCGMDLKEKKDEHSEHKH